MQIIHKNKNNIKEKYKIFKRDFNTENEDGIHGKSEEIHYIDGCMLVH